MACRRSCARTVATTLLLFLAVERLAALDPGIALRNYLHTSWTQDEGIDLPAVVALTQSSDGYLWLGTTDGPIRFDGMRFVRWRAISNEKLPDERIRYLRASSQGGVWVGADTGVYRLDRGRVQKYSSADQWLHGRIAGMAEDSGGRLWMVRPGTQQAELAVLSPDGSIQSYGPADGLPHQRVRSVFFDQANHLWIGTDEEFCRWSPGAAAVCSTAPEFETVNLVENGAARLLAFSHARRTSPPNSVNPAAMHGLSGSASLLAKSVLRDRDGNFWISTAGQGLWRLSNGRLEQFTRRDGLSSDLINSMAEDREGNLWVATARGIDRFRDPKVVHWSSLEGLSSDLVTAVLPGDRGTVWVGAAAGVSSVGSDKISNYLSDSGLPAGMVLSLCIDAEKRLWAGTSGGLAYLSKGRFIEMRTAGGASLFRVSAMIQGPHGGLWLIDERQGLLAVRHGVARPLMVPGLDTREIFQFFRDRDGIVWFGYFQGGVSRFDGNSVRRFGTADGLAGGSVQAIAQDRSGVIWVGTRGGLSRYRQGHWTTWSARQGIPEEGVRAIIEDDYGALWLITAKGLLRAPLATFNESPDGSPRNLSLTVYGFNDGVKLTRTATMANPRGGKSGDGHIWIGTEDGLTMIDPGRIRNNPVPPPVAIEQMLVDGKRMDPDSPSVIRFKGQLVQITYTGLSLMVPERVHFKYLLEGHDRDWIDAGTQRNTTYVNLHPGWYRFRVIAANHDGVWNQAGAILAFRVDPYFYQTKWFLALCIAVPLLAAWGIHQMRMRRLASRFQLIAQERARLTRELHDSLLQGFSGVVYQLEAANRQFDNCPANSKQRLERAIEQADQSLQEARKAIQSMRLAALENSTLPDALTAIAKRLTEGSSVHFHLEVNGRMRHPSYDAQAGVYMIGKEAIANAVNHANATRIRAGLTYSAKELRLVVQDNGTGFDPEAAMNKSGHWGMSGMRERAAKLGADLTVDSAPGRGTKIEVVVPQK